MLSIKNSDPEHICDNPLYECLTPSCTLDKFLCRQCFSSKYPLHEGCRIELIQTISCNYLDIDNNDYILQGDITYNNDDKRMEELYNEMMLKQAASQIRMPTHVLLKYPSLIGCLAVSQDGSIVAFSEFYGKYIFVYYLKKPIQMRRYWDGRHCVSTVSISPNNEYLVGYGYQCGMILWNLKQLPSTAKYLHHDGNGVRILSFSCDSTQMFTLQQTFKVWDCQSGEVIQDIPIPEVWEFTTSTNFIYTCIPKAIPSNSIISQSMKSNGKHVKIVCFLKDFINIICANNEFIIATQFNYFQVLHARTGKLIRNINWQGNSQGFYHPQTVSYQLQSLQFAAQMDKHRVTKFCMNSLKEIKSWETSKPIEQINLQENGKCIYIVNDDEILRYQ